jgi:GT2 family glycosyltransferase
VLFRSILGDDDYYDPMFAEKMLASIGKADVCICNAVQFSESSSTIYRAHYSGFNDLLNHNTIHGGAVLYRTEAAKDKYDPHLYCAEEYDLHLRLSKEGAVFRKADHVLYYYRLHDKNKSTQAGQNKFYRRNQIEIIKSRYK